MNPEERYQLYERDKEVSDTIGGVAMQTGNCCFRPCESPDSEPAGAETAVYTDLTES